MKSRSATIWVILLFVATPWPCEPVFGGYLYGTDDTDSRLLRIDPTNGNYTQVSGSIPLIDGLAYVPEPATLLLLGLSVAMLGRRRA